jgi:hypothetical protein
MVTDDADDPWQMLVSWRTAGRTLILGEGDRSASHGWGRL